MIFAWGVDLLYCIPRESHNTERKFVIGLCNDCSLCFYCSVIGYDTVQSGKVEHTLDQVKNEIVNVLN